MQRLTKLVFQIFIFLLPTQLAYHFWPDWALVFGIRVDYLAPAIYLSDVLAIVLILLYFFQTKKNFSFGKHKYWAMILALVFLNTLFAKIPVAAFFKWLKILELYLLFSFIKNYRLDFYKDFLKPLILSSFFVSLIGILQVIKSQTLGGPLYFFGERSFNIFTPGIALSRILGKDFLRAYSTFSHPNSLAGFLSIVLILTIFNKDKLLKNLFTPLAMMVIILCFILSFSLGAAVSIILGLVFYKFFKKNPPLVLGFTLAASLLFLFLPLTNLPNNFSESMEKRLVLAEASRKIFLENPILGIGLNNFTASKISWTLQPVHNNYLLVLAETGLVGLLGFTFILSNILKKSATFKNPALFISLLFIVFVGLFDHYFLTLQQNLLLFSLVLGYSQKRKQ